MARKLTGKKWLKKVYAEYEFNSHEKETAELAANCLDRILQAQDCIKQYGLLVPDSKGSPKKNPALSIEHDNKVLFARLCRELSLYEGAEPDVRLPRK